MNSGIVALRMKLRDATAGDHTNANTEAAVSHCTHMAAGLAQAPMRSVSYPGCKLCISIVYLTDSVVNLTSVFPVYLGCPYYHHRLAIVSYCPGLVLSSSYCRRVGIYYVELPYLY